MSGCRVKPAYLFVLFFFFDRHLLTIQNQSPVFKPPLESTYFFPEYNATKPGDPLLELSAEDPDNSDLDFGVMGEFYNKLVEIKKIDDNRAVVILKQPFDREVQEKYENIVFYVRDPPGNQILQTVRFVITDIDDNAPIFINQPYKVSVTENQSVNAIIFDSVLAFDLDGPLYNQMYFSLAGNNTNKFSIRTQITPSGYYQGLVRLESALDYETDKFHLLRISASGGMHNTIAEFTVDVIDSPDMRPVFSRSPYYVKIAEEMPINETFFTVFARDGDYGIDNQCIYEIIYDNLPSTYFEINEMTGVLRIKERIDRESNDISQFGDLLEFRIVARELNDMQSSSSASIAVAIIDINDNDPMFNSQIYNLTIRPKTIDGSILTVCNDKQIYVHDADKGINGSFTLSIHRIIDNANGNLVYLDNDDMDFDVFPKIALNYAYVHIRVKNSTSVNSKMGLIEHYLLQAKDNGIDGRVVYVELFINIESINEYPPKFNRDLYLFDLNENSAFNTTVGYVQAYDDDLKHSQLFGNFHYTLKNGQNRFAIDNTTGRVFTISENPTTDLDRELIDTFYLSVDAIDGGGLSTSCKLIVKLNDLNDNAPKFLPKHQFSFTGSIEENSIKWLENVYLMAVDADLGSNAFIQYEIIGGDFFHMFDIDSDKSNRLILKNNKTLDFEELFKSINKTTNLFNNNEILINLVVEARDGGSPSLSDKASINVIVKDVNDNSPKFEFKEYRARVFETDSHGYVIQVNATDLDAQNTPNSRISYMISSGSKEKFLIDPNSGIIRIANSNTILDRDIYGSNYTLKVVANDHGATNVNTNDLADNYCFVFIDVIDVNDKKPKFDSPLSVVKIPENIEPNTTVVSLKATDSDTNARLKYTIVDPIDKFNNDMQAFDENRHPIDSGSLGNWFDINQNTGDFYVKSSIDREIAQYVEMKVYVEDLNAHENFRPQISSTLLKIEITDVNDNYPQFEHFDRQLDSKPDGTPVYELRIKLPESLPLHTNVLRIRAVDFDKAKNITYSIDSSEYFRIDKVTGDLNIDRLINYETVKWLNVSISAHDNSTPISKSSQLNIYCEIEDINDNYPMFTQVSSNNVHLLHHHNASYQNVTIRIKRTSQTGDELFQVHTIDIDTGLNSEIYYYFDELFFNDNDWKHFFINSQDGRVYLNTKINHENKAAYFLNIIASDRGFLQLKSQLIVQVLIVDEFNSSVIFQKKQICLSSDLFKCEFNYESILIERVENTNDLLIGLFNLAQIGDTKKTADDICYYLAGGNRDGFFLNKTSGALYAKTKFDYETVQLYEILIRATENCTCELLMPNTSQTVFCEDLDEIPYDAINDLSRIKIKLKIIDVNDNEPYFTKTSYRLGLTPDISYGESILEGFAIDRDSSSQMRFEINETSLVKTVDNLTKQASYTNKFPFSIEYIDMYTGRTNATSTIAKFHLKTQAYFDAGTSFKFQINVYDESGQMGSNNNNNKANVIIYILNKRQRVRFLSSQWTDSFKMNEHDFKSTVDNITGLQTNIDSVVVHRTTDKRRIYPAANEPRTDILAHFTERQTTTNDTNVARVVIIPASNVLKMLYNFKNIGYLNNFGLISAEHYDNADMYISFMDDSDANNTIQYLDSGDDALDDNQFSIIRLVLFILCCSFLLIILFLLVVCFVMRRNYRKKLEIERNLGKAFDHKNLYTFNNLAFNDALQSRSQSTISEKTANNLDGNDTKQNLSEFYLKNLGVESIDKFNCLSFNAQASEKLVNIMMNDNYNIMSKEPSSIASSPISNLKKCDEKAAQLTNDNDCSDLYLLESTLI